MSSFQFSIQLIKSVNICVFKEVKNCCQFVYFIFDDCSITAYIYIVNTFISLILFSYKKTDRSEFPQLGSDDGNAFLDVAALFDFVDHRDRVIRVGDDGFAPIVKGQFFAAEDVFPAAFAVSLEIPCR